MPFNIGWSMNLWDLLCGLLQAIFSKHTKADIDCCLNFFYRDAFRDRTKSDLAAASLGALTRFNNSFFN